MTSQNAIVSVRRDLASQPTNVGSEPITNSRGQQRPATYARTEPDVIDAEVIEDDEPTHVNRETGEITPNAARWTPLPECDRRKRSRDPLTTTPPV